METARAGSAARSNSGQQALEFHSTPFPGGSTFHILEEGLELKKYYDVV